MDTQIYRAVAKNVPWNKKAATSDTNEVCAVKLQPVGANWETHKETRNVQLAAQMGTYAETANVDHSLSIAYRGKQTSIFQFFGRKLMEVCSFCLQQTNGSCHFPLVPSSVYLYIYCIYIEMAAYIPVYCRYIQIQIYISIYRQREKNIIFGREGNKYQTKIQTPAFKYGSGSGSYS